VGGVVVDLGLVADFHDAAQIHHSDAIGDVADHRQVMGDEDVGDPELVLDLLQQVHDLRLYRHVQRGHGLVADDDVRVER